MYALMITLYVVVVLVALLLIGLILIQHSKGGLGATFGGVGESVFGARAGNHLTKMTVILTTIFFVLILVLAVVSGHRNDNALNLKPANASTTVVPVKASAAVPAAAPATGEKTAGGASAAKK